MGYPSFTFRSELSDYMPVRKEFEHLYAQIEGILKAAGIQADGSFSTLRADAIITNNVTVNPTTSTTTSVILKATRTLTRAQIISSRTTPVELLSPTGTSTAPGVGFMCCPFFIVATLATSEAFTNVASDARLNIHIGSIRRYGPVVPSHLGAPLTQTVHSPFAAGADLYALAADLDNQPLKVEIENSAGALTGGTGAEYTVTVYYVVEPTTTAAAGGLIVYTTSVRKVTPSAATRISITPSGTAFANSAWAEVTASAAADWALAGIAFNPGADAGYLQFEVGVGAAGSELSIAAISGDLETEATCPDHSLRWPIPVAKISSGDRVAVRMAKAGTDVTAWTVALEYYETPLAGNALSTTTVPALLSAGVGNVAITPSSTAWAYSAWAAQTAINPLSQDYLLFGVTLIHPNQPCEYEIDIATGAPGMETVRTTIRGRIINIVSGSGGILHQPLAPTLLLLEAGEAVSVRMRKSGTNTATWSIDLCAYPAAAFPLLTSAGQMKWVPAGTDATSITSGGAAWSNGAYSTFLTTTTTTAIMAVLVWSTGSSGEGEIDLATGTPGNEVVISTVRYRSNSNQHGFFSPCPLVVGRTVASGAIISARVRASGGLPASVAIGYIEDQDDVYQQLATAQVVYPPAAAGVSVSGANSAWANSLYGELTSATATAVYLTTLNYDFGVSNVHVEFDLAVGAASSEVVIGTWTTYVVNSGKSQIALEPPPRVASGSRVAIRFRKEGTSTAAWGFAITAVPTA